MTLEHQRLLALTIVILFLWLRGAWLIIRLTSGAAVLLGEPSRITVRAYLVTLLWPITWMLEGGFPSSHKRKSP